MCHCVPQMDDALPDVPAQHAAYRYVLLAPPEPPRSFLDGDAANGFDKPRHPKGLQVGEGNYTPAKIEQR
jgi:hypothetical protein